MTIGNLLATREKTHGDYKTKAETIQGLKRRMRCVDGWDNLTPYQRESLEMIASKIGRILHGNPDEIDHWQDIAGYAERSRCLCAGHGDCSEPCNRQPLLRQEEVNKMSQKSFFRSDFGQLLLAFGGIMLASFFGTLIAGTLILAVMG